MIIGILDLDNKKEANGVGKKEKYPNIACAKIYGYHMKQGDVVVFPWDMHNPIKVDRLYISTIFTSSRNMIKRNLTSWKLYADEILIGGSGWDDYPNGITKLPPEIENVPHYPYVYEMYDIDYTIGFSTRGCHVGCGFCMVWRKEGLVEYKDSPIESMLNPRGKHLVLMNNNSFAHDSFLDDIEIIKKNKLSVHWDQANDITLVTPKIIEAVKSVNYRGFDGIKKQLFFAFDLMQKEKTIDIKTASKNVLDSIDIQRFEWKSPRTNMIYPWCKYNGEFMEMGKIYVDKHQDTVIWATYSEHKKTILIHVEYAMISVVPRQIEFMKNNGINPKHLVFYLLLGYNTNEKEDLARVECLKKANCEIYPMLYRDLKGRPNVDHRGNPQPFHVRAMRDWLNPKVGLYRKTPFHEFDRREKHFIQRRNQDNQLKLF